MNHRVASLFLCILFSVVSLAQSSMISVSRDARLNRTAQLGGKAGVLFYSKSPDLVISTTVNSDPKVTMPKALGNNVYEYEMLLDVSGAADRVFKVSKKGTVISTKTGQVLLKANAYVGFNVDIVEKPIYMELSDEGGHYILHGNGWALIEINSEIKITPNYNSNLKLEHRSSRSVAGVYVDSLIINVESLQNLHTRLETVRTELDKLNAEYDALLTRNTSESALNRLDKKIKEVETTVSSLSKELDELSFISVKGEGTNERVIDAEEILALKSKEKRKYNVILQSKPQDGGATARPSVTSQYVLFKVTPSNAMVELDGQTLEVVDGTIAKRMPFGTYSYKVQAPRHAVKSGTIVVNDPKNKHIVNISLEPQYVNAKFSVANNAEIWVDEQKRGTGSCTLELGYGAYLVECRLPGHKPSQQEVLIGKGSDSGVITLTPPTPIYGSVDINSTPADAEVWIDGKKLGTTPLFLSESLVGEHKLKVCKLGYKDQTATIVVVEGQTTASSITLEKETPEYNNRTHNLKVTKSGYKDYRSKMGISEGQKLGYNSVLENRVTKKKFPDTGYSGMLDINYALVINCDYCKRFSLTTVHGYQINPYIFFGVGLGLNCIYEKYYDDLWSDTSFSVPVFADARTTLPLKSNFALFLDFRIGYYFADENGGYVSPSVGVRIGRETAFTLSLGYETMIDNQYHDYHEHLFNFRIGFEW